MKVVLFFLRHHLLLLLASVVVVALAQEGGGDVDGDGSSSLEPRCNDCWCIPAEGESCPTDTQGIWQSFPSGWIERYKSFQLMSPTLTLQAQDGGDLCYPFAGSVDPSLVTYPESQVSPCVKPSESSTTAVCAFVSDDMSCSGREYTVQDFESADAASEDGTNARVIHSGSCGVCSNAHDLAVRMEFIDTLKSQSIGCGFEYAVGGQDFSNLIKCYETVGFTNPCATLWAHFTATNSNLCAGLCIPQNGEIAMNDLTQPNCPYTACYNCSVSFGNEFNLLGGIWRFAYNAGFNDNTAHPCSVFTRTPQLDPCTGVAPTVSPAPTSETTLAPGASPPSGGGGGSGGTSQTSAAADAAASRLQLLRQSTLGAILLLGLVVLVL